MTAPHAAHPCLLVTLAMALPSLAFARQLLGSGATTASAAEGSAVSTGAITAIAAAVAAAVALVAILAVCAGSKAEKTETCSEASTPPKVCRNGLVDTTVP